MTRKKLLCLGQGRDGKVFINATLKGLDVHDWELSLSGVIGPKGDGDCIGPCGQIQAHLIESIEEYFKPWDELRVGALIEIWKDYHLNVMTAGSPRQESYLKHKVPTLHLADNTYENRAMLLKNAGLNPDEEYFNFDSNEPYVYGSAWLHTKLPLHVIGWFSDLPESTHELPRKWR